MSEWIIAIAVGVLLCGCCVPEESNRALGNKVTYENGKVCSQSEFAKMCGRRCPEGRR